MSVAPGRVRGPAAALRPESGAACPEARDTVPKTPPRNKAATGGLAAPATSNTGVVPGWKGRHTTVRCWIGRLPPLRATGRSGTS